MEIFGVYTVPSVWEPGGGCSLPPSLIYRRMQMVVERRPTHTHCGVFVYTHRRSRDKGVPLCARLCPHAL